MVRLVSLLACLFLLVPNVRAQDAPSSATPDQLRSWLRHDDPRMIAWAATFIRDQKSNTATGDLIKLLRNWSDDSASVDQTTAMWLVLDALIERHLRVPADAVDAISQSFPAAAAILIARLPWEESQPVLRKWYGDGTGQNAGQDAAQLVRIAALMLANQPPSGFAASVLERAEETLWIDVYDDHTVSPPQMETASCGDSYGVADNQGWPPTFFYFLEEGNPRGREDQTVVTLQQTRITYQRKAYNRGWNSCFRVKALNAASRHELLAAMLDTSGRSLPWQVHSSNDLKWSNAGQFQADLNAVVTLREKEFQPTTAALLAKGLISENEAKSIRPRLLVFLRDARTHPGTMLPQPVFRDRRTVWLPDPPEE